MFFFITIERLRKIFDAFLCRHREDCATASERKCAAASEYIIFVQKTVKENVQLIFFYIEDCMIASEDISMFFNERAAAS